MRSFGERMVVPLMNFLLLTFLPLKKIYSSSKGSFIAANGQFLIVDRETYDAIGGHTVVADKVVEDMELARRIKKRGFRMMTFLGENSITCRMYSGFKEAFTGFTKNYYPGFNTSALNFLLILVFVFITFFLPFLMIFMNSIFLWSVLIILIGRFATSLASKQNFLLNCMAHPIQIILMLAVGISSVTKTKKKKIEWKGRFI
jgi:chlorobactene glucosyltransferase